MSKAKPQMPTQVGQASVARGEAGCDLASDEACDPLSEHPDTGLAKAKAGTGGLLEKALTRENLQAAWKRVKANKGAPGVDGLDIGQTAQMVRTQWPHIRQELLVGGYRPSPVRRVMIPKPDGSQRELGIPTVLERQKGAPQGGPLSPLLANVLLDEVDKVLEARGYSFARYADDCNVYVGSAFGRKFLGYALWVAKGKEVKCKVAEKPMHNFKARIRQLTRRSGGGSMEQVVEKLKAYLLGWKSYFGLAQTPKVWRELDEWLRHRMRAIELKHWKRPGTIYRELKALGATENVAKRVAVNSSRWWRNSDRLLKTVLTIAYFDQAGLPRLS